MNEKSPGALLLHSSFIFWNVSLVFSWRRKRRDAPRRAAPRRGVTARAAARSKTPLRTHYVFKTIPITQASDYLRVILWRPFVTREKHMSTFRIVLFFEKKSSCCALTACFPSLSFFSEESVLIIDKFGLNSR